MESPPNMTASPRYLLPWRSSPAEHSGMCSLVCDPRRATSELSGVFRGLSKAAFLVFHPFGGGDVRGALQTQAGCGAGQGVLAACDGAWPRPRMQVSAQEAGSQEEGGPPAGSIWIMGGAPPGTVAAISPALGPLEERRASWGRGAVRGPHLCTPGFMSQVAGLRVDRMCPRPGQLLSHSVTICVKAAVRGSEEHRGLTLGITDRKRRLARGHLQSRRGPGCPQGWGSGDAGLRTALAPQACFTQAQ